MSTLHQNISGLTRKKLTLQDIQCKLHFISSADEIGKLLVTFPPRVSISDAADNDKVPLAQAVLDVRLLFNNNKVRSPPKLDPKNILQLHSFVITNSAGM